MTKLSNINIVRVQRRISSGDNGAPLDPPLTAEEIEAGGRLEQFVLVSATGDDAHGYQWTLEHEVSDSDIRAAIQAWFQNGKPSDTTSPMLTAIDTPPPESWDTAA